MNNNKSGASLAWLLATRIHYSPNSPSKMPPNVLVISFHEHNDGSLNKPTLKLLLPSHVSQNKKKLMPLQSYQKPRGQMGLLGQPHHYWSGDVPRLKIQVGAEETVLAWLI